MGAPAADADLALTGIISGGGALTKTGGSTLTLASANTYSGETWIQSGTLALSGSGAIASSSRVVADGTFDISAVTPASANIQSLAGGGTVNARHQEPHDHERRQHLRRRHRRHGRSHRRRRRADFVRWQQLQRHDDGQERRRAARQRDEHVQRRLDGVFR